MFVKPSTVPPPPQNPPQSTLPSRIIEVASPVNASVSMLVTCISSISPSIERRLSPSILNNESSALTHVPIKPAALCGVTDSCPGLDFPPRTFAAIPATFSTNPKALDPKLD